MSCPAHPYLLATLAALMAAAPVHAQPAPAGPTDDGNELVVVGRAERLYRPGRTTAGRGAADPLDIPQALTVINSQLARDQGARDTTDLYRNIAGISTFSYSGVTLRGFRQDQVFYDNLRGNPFIGFTVPRLFNIERVEVLKGPAGMLYGPSPPGGLINYVTKVPQDAFAAEATLVAGTDERRGGSIEVTGPLDPDGVALARVGLFYEYREPFRANTDDEIGLYDVGLTLRPFEDIELIIQATRTEQKLDANRLRGVPVDNDGNFLTDISWNHNEPTDFLDLRADAWQARLFWTPLDDLSVEIGGRYFEARERQQYHEPFGLRDTNGDGRFDTSLRQFRDQLRESDGRAVSALVQYQTELFGVSHDFLLGGDWSDEDTGSFSRLANPTAPGLPPVPSLSLTNPVYGLTNASRYALSRRVASIGDSTATRRGVFLQDKLDLLPELSLVAGVRYDEFEDEIRRPTRARFEESATTLRGGVIWRPLPDLATYLSYSETFEPQAAGVQTPLAGGPFDPEEGDQIELGAKLDLMGGRVQGTAALYEINRTNLLQATGLDAGGDGINDSAPLGEVRSRGLELEVTADVTPDWVVSANYAYNYTVVTATSPRATLTNAVGDRFANAPRHQAGFWTRYEVPELDTALALGGQYVGERISLSGQTVKDYAIFDASLITQLGERVEVLLRVENLFDEVYAESGFIDRTGHFPGEPRQAFLEVRASW